MASQNRQYETGYQALGSFYDEEHEDTPPAENIIHVVPDRNKSRWNHIEDLDEFFNRVYQYHQRNGFLCMVFQDVMQLVQFAFVVLFSTFLLNCVDYDTLFYEKEYNGTHKVSIGEAVYPLDQCVARFDWLIIVCLLMACLFWLFRLIKMIYNICQYMEIRAFYVYALKIPAEELCNLTWHEVQRCVLEVQQEEQMCIHKQNLSELDIYHRILRFKNYLIAMVNKTLVPLTYRVPFVGDYAIMTTGLKYNLEMILFWGPWAPFENNWHLKADYKNYHKRKELAEQLSQKIRLVGLANFVLSPLIFLWQILYSFFRYAESVKRSPGTLGARRWSLYGRLYLRHFNELDHEFNARLNRGYRPAERYMSSFTTPFLTILAKYLAFFTGSVLAVFVILTLVDEDFLGVSHVITIMAVLTAVTAICHGVIPDEHMVWCPELLMRAVLSQIHYMPDHWKGNAHTYKVRDEFSTLFQYKAVYLIEELLSPIITPLILCFKMPQRAIEIVDFYRNFTVEVTGVGDVCSFAQMDVRKHGNPQWMADSETEASQNQQTVDGKTELSLMHFTYTNPEWKPPEPSHAFLSMLRERAQQDANSMSVNPYDNPLANSLHSLTSVGFGQYNSMISSVVQASSIQPPTPSSAPSMSFPRHPPPPSASSSSSSLPRPPSVRGAGVRQSEGPLGGSTHGILSSITQASGGGAAGGVGVSSMASSQRAVTFAGTEPATRAVDEQTLELLSNEMSISALYMHELHRKRVGAGPERFGTPRRNIYEDIPGSASSLPTRRFDTGGGGGSNTVFTRSGFQGGIEMKAPPSMQPIPAEDEAEDYLGATAGGRITEMSTSSSPLNRSSTELPSLPPPPPPPPRSRSTTPPPNQHRIDLMLDDQSNDSDNDSQRLIGPFS